MQSMRIDLNNEQISLLMCAFNFVEQSNAIAIVPSKYEAVKNLITVIAQAGSELSKKKINYRSLEIRMADSVATEVLGMVSAIVSNRTLKDRFIEANSVEQFTLLEDLNLTLYYAFVASRPNVASA